MKGKPKTKATYWIRLAVFVILLVAAGISIVRGVKLYDIQETITNATILCLSCVGIG